MMTIEYRVISFHYHYIQQHQEIGDTSSSLEPVKAWKYSHERHSYVNVYSDYTTQCHRDPSINAHHFMRVIFC